MTEQQVGALKSDVDLRRVFASPELCGLYGFKPLAQTRDYTCGAAAVASVLQWFGEHADEVMCAQAMGTNKVVGTTPEDMVRYLKHRGLKAWAHTDTPIDYILGRARAGQVTLVDWNDYGGHWVVVAGYDPLSDAIVLADPARPRSHFACHTLDRFKEHWHCDGFGRVDSRGRPRRLRQLALFVERFARGRTFRKTGNETARVRSFYYATRRPADKLVSA